MEVYRLTREKFSELNGKGAAIHDQRWNSMGVEMIYTGMNRSLAMAEVAVHLTIATLPADYKMLTIYIPDDISLQKINIKDLPENWNCFPQQNLTQSIGDKFILENKYCALQVPSVITLGDFNLLLNPFHEEFKKIKIISKDDFPFDNRILKVP